MTQINNENSFQEKLNTILNEHNNLVFHKKNQKKNKYNGIYDQYINPILTAQHIPIKWRYDLNPGRNPFLMERIQMNAVFNAGAIKWKNKYIVIARIEGADRKSFFAIAESPNGIDQFEFWEKPITIPQHDEPETNIYDIRLTLHEDGWIYGLFCVERRDPNVTQADQSSAIAQCGIIRTKDLINWERLQDLISDSPQQRNVVLHPEFINGEYALYTRPQDSFINAGTGGGIAIAYTKDMKNAIVKEEKIIAPKIYHTVYESKNGQGPAPIKSPIGWIHLAHGVRNTAAGLRYVLYLFVTDLNNIEKVIYRPGGYFMAPQDDERIGDVSNVLFCNGWITDNNNVYIYYASSDTRLHVATTTIEQLCDYAINTPEDKYTSAESVKSIVTLISKNNEE